MLKTALDHHGAGRVQQAEKLYREVLRNEKDHPDANHLLGVLAYQSGNINLAKSLITKAIEKNSGEFSYYCNLGLVLQEKGEMNQAITAFRRSIHIQPFQSEAYYNLGNVLLKVENYADALSVFSQAYKVEPHNAKALNGIGNALTALGRHEEAITAYQGALQIYPNYDDARYNLGKAYQELGNYEEAEKVYRLVLENKPDLSSAYNNLGVIQRAQCRMDEAETSYMRAIKNDPEQPKLYVNLGEVLLHQGRTEDAVESYKKALAIDPSYTPAIWGELLSLPVLYESITQIKHTRDTWFEGLNKLLTVIDLTSDKGIRDAKDAASMFTNFYLNYQGCNDKSAQALYGRLLTRIAYAAYPEVQVPKDVADNGPSSKIRVGFVSSCFYNHSIFKTHGQWITKLSQKDFDVSVFYLGHIRDWATEEIASRANRFVSTQEIDELISSISSGQLDVLVYTDLGMEPRLQLISALRLVPVQCNGGGHPVTSGLPTIDYFLGSDLMEPQDGCGHYTEELVRLPNLASSYPYPQV